MIERISYVDQRKVRSDLKVLKKYCAEEVNAVDIYRILQGCPFDANRNINTLLTQELFFSKLFVKTPKIDELESDLCSLLHTFGTRILFLYGFSGIGKTTFINYFSIRNLFDFHIKVIDFQKPTIESTDNLLFEFIRREILLDFRRERESFIVIAISFIKSNPSAFTGYLSKKFLDTLVGESGVDTNPKKIEKIIAALNDEDVILFLFYYLMLNYSRCAIKKNTVIIFDNLDAVKIEYTTNYIVNIFSKCITMGTDLSQDSNIFETPIDFRFLFRFVFLLREANNIDIMAQISDSEGYAQIKHIPFQMRFENDLYQRMAVKRFEFCKEIGLNLLLKKTEEFESFIHEILNHNSFKNTVVPLFNYDFKKTIDGICSLVRINEIVEYCQKSRIYNYISNDEKYGIGAILNWGIINYIKIENFLVLYDRRDEDSELIGNGHCNETRMILTVLLNLSPEIKGISSFNHQKEFRVSLFDVGKIFERIIDVDNLFRKIARMFLTHQKNWVHLISIQNKFIKDRNSLSNEARMFKLVTSSTTQEKDREEMIKLLRGIKIRINPSGYVYIKKVKIHFEYYSVRAKNLKSLFAVTRIIQPDGRYEFEEIIENVIKLVEIHLKNMTTFFSKKFGDDVESKEKYLKSMFCFRHTGKESPNSLLTERREAGIFHGLRVLTAHIGYIDNFRLFFLRECEANQENVEINKRLVNYLKKYALLVGKYYRSTGGGYYFREFTKKIRNVELKEFKDFTLSIGQLKED